MDWLNSITDLVASNNLAMFWFSDDEWSRLTNSRRGFSQFTVARSHSLLSGFSVPTVGLLLGKVSGETPEIYFGLVKTRHAISTLESRVRIDSALPISPSTKCDLLKLVTRRGFKTKFRSALKPSVPVVSVESDLSVHLIQRLADNDSNHWAMQSVVAALDSPNTYADNAALQQDALNLALRTFGVSSAEIAMRVDLTFEGRETAISRVEPFAGNYVPIFEDAVIEHDARNVPGFYYVDDDLTGRAIYENGVDTLEIITANRRPLEEVFGVDLIYLNAVKENVVMVQYKMLEPHPDGRSTDWIYRPDRQFEEEMARMKFFSQLHPPGFLEYRINPQVFYLRFVKRDAKLGKATVTVPIDHFDVLRDNPECRGPRGGFRITYDTLGGRYLRQEAFVDLVRSGYIGAHAKTTADLETLIREILNGNRALVAALHSTRSSRN